MSRIDSRGELREPLELRGEVCEPDLSLDRPFEERGLVHPVDHGQFFVLSEGDSPGRQNPFASLDPIPAHPGHDDVERGRAVGDA